jgi:hypothetical protein
MQFDKFFAGTFAQCCDILTPMMYFSLNTILSFSRMSSGVGRAEGEVRLLTG